MPDIAGLKLIVPTSVAGTGVSVSASGKVTFSGASSVSVNGCFSATYDNYLLVGAGLQSSDTALRSKWRSAGSDATGNYARQYIFVDGTSISAARNSPANEATVADFFTTATNGFVLYAYGPFLAAPTAQRSDFVYGSGGACTGIYVNTHSLSTSYDGISIIPNSGTITGSMTIYGLSQ